MDFGYEAIIEPTEFPGYPMKGPSGHPLPEYLRPKNHRFILPNRVFITRIFGTMTLSLNTLNKAGKPNLKDLARACVEMTLLAYTLDIS